MYDAELEHAHGCCHGKHDAVLASATCGCCYCGAIFAPAEVREWITEGSGAKTALCPQCGIDAVLASDTGFPITAAFLARMHAAWF